MIGRFDAAVLARFQGVVEFTGLQPITLARAFFAASVLAHFAFHWVGGEWPSGWRWAVLGLSWSISIFLLCVPPLLSWFYGWMPMRLTPLAVLALLVPLYALVPAEAKNGVHLLRELVYVGFGYFAACRPPAPPRRRPRAMTEGFT